jgi:hypothetical protein
MTQQAQNMLALIRNYHHDGYDAVPDILDQLAFAIEAYPGDYSQDEALDAVQAAVLGGGHPKTTCEYYWTGVLNALLGGT